MNNCKIHQNISNSIRNLTRKVVLGEFSNTDIYSVYYSFKNNSAYGGYKTFTNTLQTELMGSLKSLSKDKKFIFKYKEKYGISKDTEITPKEIIKSFIDNMPEEIEEKHPINLADYLTDKFGEIEASAEKTLSSDLDQVLIPLFKDNNMNVLSSLKKVKQSYKDLILKALINEDKLNRDNFEDNIMTQIVNMCRTYFDYNPKDQPIKSFITVLKQNIENPDYLGTLSSDAIRAMSLICYLDLFAMDKSPELKPINSLISVNPNKELKHGKLRINSDVGKHYNQFADENEDGTEYLGTIAVTWLSSLKSNVGLPIDYKLIIGAFNKLKAVTPIVDNKGNRLTDDKYMIKILDLDHIRTSNLTEMEQQALFSFREALVQLSPNNVIEELFKPDTLSNTILHSLIITQNQDYSVITVSSDGNIEVQSLQDRANENMVYNVRDIVNSKTTMLKDDITDPLSTISKDDVEVELKPAANKGTFNINSYTLTINGITKNILDLVDSRSVLNYLNPEGGIYLFESYNLESFAENIYRELNEIASREEISEDEISDDLKWTLAILNKYSGFDFTLEGLADRNNGSDYFASGDIIFNAISQTKQTGRYNVTNKLKAFLSVAIQNAFTSNISVSQEHEQELADFKQEALNKDSGKFRRAVDNFGNLQATSDWPALKFIATLQSIINLDGVSSVIRVDREISYAKNRVRNMASDPQLVMARELDESGKNIRKHNLFVREKGLGQGISTDVLEQSMQIPAVILDGETVELATISAKDRYEIEKQLFYDAFKFKEYKSNVTKRTVYINPLTISDKTSWYYTGINLNNIISNNGLLNLGERLNNFFGEGATFDSTDFRNLSRDMLLDMVDSIFAQIQATQSQVYEDYYNLFNFLITQINDTSVNSDDLKSVIDKYPKLISKLKNGTYSLSKKNPIIAFINAYEAFMDSDETYQDKVALATAFLQLNTKDLPNLIKDFQHLPKKLFYRDNINYYPNFVENIYYTPQGISTYTLLQSLLYDYVNQDDNKENRLKRLLQSDLFHSITGNMYKNDINNIQTLKGAKDYLYVLTYDILKRNYLNLTLNISTAYTKRNLSDDVLNDIDLTTLSYKKDGENTHKAIIKHESELYSTMAKRAVPFSASIITPTYYGAKGVGKVLNVAVLDETPINLTNYSGITDSYDATDGSVPMNPLYVKFLNNSFGESRVGEEHLKIFGELYDKRLGTPLLAKCAGFPLTNGVLRDSCIDGDSALRTFKKMLNRRLDADTTLLLFRTLGKYFNQDGIKKPYIPLNKFTNNSFYNRISDVLANSDTYFDYVQLSDISINENGEVIIKLLGIDSNNPTSVFELQDITLPITEYNTLFSMWEILGGAFSKESLGGNYGEYSLDTLFDCLMNLAPNEETAPIVENIRDNMTHIAGHKSGLKVGAGNANTMDPKYDDEEFNYSVTDSAFFGIQGNFDHPTDDADISSPTQMISLISQGVQTNEQAQILYNDLSKLIMSEYKSFGIDLTSDTYDKLITSLSGLFTQLNLNAREGNLQQIAKAFVDKEGDFRDILKEGIPFSSPDVFNQFFSRIVSLINRIAIRQKLPGNANVLHPAYNKVKYFTLYNPETGEFDRVSRKELVEGKYKLGYDSEEELEQAIISGNYSPVISSHQLCLGETYFATINNETKIVTIDTIHALQNAQKEVGQGYVYRRHYQENLLPNRLKINGVDEEGNTYSNIAYYNIPEVQDLFTIMDNYEKYIYPFEVNTDFGNTLLNLKKSGASKEQAKAFCVNFVNSLMVNIYNKGSVEAIVGYESNVPIIKTINITSYKENPAEAVISNALAENLGITRECSIHDILTGDSISQAVTKHLDRLELSFKNIQHKEDYLALTADRKTQILYSGNIDYKSSTYENFDITKNYNVENIDGVYFYVDSKTGIPIIEANGKNKIFYIENRVVAYSSDIINALDKVLSATAEYDYILTKTNVPKLGNSPYTKWISEKDFTNSEYKNKLHSEIVNNRKESFREYLKIISGRIPAQNMQSVMAMKVIGFTSNKNTSMYVSPMQLYLQGSDLDIDKSYTMYKEMSRKGQLYKWTPYFTSNNDKIMEKLISFPSADIEANTPKMHLKGKNLSSYKIVENQDVINSANRLYELCGLKEFSIDSIIELLDSENGEEVATLIKTILDYYANTDNRNKPITKDGNSGINAFIEDLINTHFSYGSGNTDFQIKGFKNKIVYSMYHIIKDIRNSTSTLEPVSMDRSKEPLKTAEEDALSQMTISNPMFTPILTSTNMAGKDNIARMAVFEKTYYALKIFKDSSEYRDGFNVDVRLSYPTIDENGNLKTIPLHITDPTAALTQYDNDYADELEKIKELEGELAELKAIVNPTKTQKSRIKSLEETLIPNEYSVLKDKFVDPEIVVKMISELLSLSTDNAKELALSKLNCDPVMSIFYGFGLLMGMDYRDIYSFMKQPFMFAFKEFSDGAVLQGINSYRDLKTALRDFKYKLLANNANNEIFDTLLSRYQDYLSKYNQTIDKAGLIELTKTYFNNLTDILKQQDVISFLGRSFAITNGLNAVPNKFIQFKNTLEKHYITAVSGSSFDSTDNEFRTINLYKYFSDESYRALLDKKYESLGNIVNPFKVIYANPHYRAIYRIIGEINEGMSHVYKYRVQNYIIDNYKSNNGNLIKVNEFPKIDSAINTATTKFFFDYLKDFGITFNFKGGSEYYGKQIIETVPEVTTLSLVLDSTTSDNFKKFVETLVFKYLKQDSDFTDNKFIQSLKIVTYKNNTFLGNPRKSLASSLDFSSPQVSDSEEFKNLASALNDIKDKELPIELISKTVNGEQKALTVEDVLKLYTYAVYNNRSARNSFKKLFDSNDYVNDIKADSINMLYYDYISKLDSEYTRLAYQPDLIVNSDNKEDFPLLWAIYQNNNFKENGSPWLTTDEAKRPFIEVINKLLLKMFKNSAFNPEYKPGQDTNNRTFLFKIRERVEDTFVTNYFKVKGVSMPIFIEHAMFPIGLELESQTINVNGWERSSKYGFRYRKYGNRGLITDKITVEDTDFDFGFDEKSDGYFNSEDSLNTYFWLIDKFISSKSDITEQDVKNIKDFAIDYGIVVSKNKDVKVKNPGVGLTLIRFLRYCPDILLDKINCQGTPKTNKFHLNNVLSILINYGDTYAKTYLNNTQWESVPIKNVDDKTKSEYIASVSEDNYVVFTSIGNKRKIKIKFTDNYKIKDAKIFINPINEKETISYTDLEKLSEDNPEIRESLDTADEFLMNGFNNIIENLYNNSGNTDINDEGELLHDAYLYLNC